MPPIPRIRLTASNGLWERASAVAMTTTLPNRTMSGRTDDLNEMKGPGACAAGPFRQAIRLGGGAGRTAPFQFDDSAG